MGAITVTFHRNAAEAADIRGGILTEALDHARTRFPLLREVETYPAMYHSNLFRGSFRDLYTPLAVARDVRACGAMLLWFPFNPGAAWAVCFHKLEIPTLEAATFFTGFSQAWASFMALAKEKRG